MGHCHITIAHLMTRRLCLRGRHWHVTLILLTRMVHVIIHGVGLNIMHIVAVHWPSHHLIISLLHHTIGHLLWRTHHAIVIHLRRIHHAIVRLLMMYHARVMITTATTPAHIVKPSQYISAASTRASMTPLSLPYSLPHWTACRTSRVLTLTIMTQYTPTRKAVRYPTFIVSTTSHMLP